MAKIAKSEVTPGLVARTARYPQVLVLGTPGRLSLVPCRVWDRHGQEWETDLPWQALLW